MLKRDKNFRLSKTVKRMIAGKLCQNPNQYKRMMIEAEILGSIVPKKSKKDKDSEE